MAKPLTSLAPLADLLDQHPFALLCDVDGTLSPLAAEPRLARVTPRNRELLAALSRHLLVAVVSGRDLVDLQQMVGLPEIVFIGLHGLAWRIAGVDEIAPEAQRFVQYTREAAGELAHLKRIQGLLLEQKAVGLALHYRNSRDRTARTQILRAIASSAAAGRFEIHEGIRLIELRPPIGITKGVAVRRLADRFGLRGLLFLGDDITDIDAFEEVKRLRAAGALAGYGIAIAHAEAPPAAAAAADYTLADVAGVEHLLAEILRRVAGSE